MCSSSWGTDDAASYMIEGTMLTSSRTLAQSLKDGEPTAIALWLMEVPPIFTFSPLTIAGLASQVDLQPSPESSSTALQLLIGP